MINENVFEYNEFIFTLIPIQQKLAEQLSSDIIRFQPIVITFVNVKQAIARVDGAAKHNAQKFSSTSSPRRCNTPRFRRHDLSQQPTRMSK